MTEYMTREELAAFDRGEIPIPAMTVNQAAVFARDVLARAALKSVTR